MKAKITIKEGAKTLFTGEIQSREGAYEGYKAEKEFHDDLFNIERYINTQGAYRCHIEVVASDAGEGEKA